MHSYTYTPMFRTAETEAVRTLTITIVSENKEPQPSWEVEKLVHKLFDQDLTLVHNERIDGYQEEQ